MQAHQKLTIAFDDAATPGYKFMRDGDCKITERDAKPMPGRSGREAGERSGAAGERGEAAGERGEAAGERGCAAGELVRIYDFSPGAPHAIQEERWHDGGKRREFTAFLPATGVDKETLAAAHQKLTLLGGSPPPLEHCLDPVAGYRALLQGMRA